MRLTSAFESHYILRHHVFIICLYIIYFGAFLIVCVPASALDYITSEVLLPFLSGHTTPGLANQPQKERFSLRASCGLRASRLWSVAQAQAQHAHLNHYYSHHRFNSPFIISPSHFTSLVFNSAAPARNGSPTTVG